MLNTRRFRAIIVTAIVVTTIVLAKSLVMPIIFSALCAMFMHPLVKRLEKLGLSLTFSSVIVGGVISIFLFGLFTVISYEQLC